MAETKLHTRKYDWSELFSRKGTVRLYREVDYNGVDSTFAVHMRAMAKRSGLRVSIALGVGYIDYQVIEGQKGKRKK